MIRRDHLCEPEGRYPHQTGIGSPPGEEVDELQRRPVAPVQILGDQQQRDLGVAIKEFTHLAEHSLGVRACELASQRFALVGSANPGQLQQPGRRDRP